MKSAQEISQQVQELGRWITPLREQVAHVVVGQKYLVDRLLLGLLANGHVLLEGVPGLAKTLTVKTIASAALFRAAFSVAMYRYQRYRILSQRHGTRVPAGAGLLGGGKS